MSTPMDEAVTPPHIIHEQAVLSCVLLDETTYDEMGLLTPGDFDTALHTALWTACQQLRTAGRPLSVATVEAQLAEVLALTPELRSVAQDYVRRVTSTYPVPVGADYHAEKVRSYARLRWARTRAERIIALADADDLRGLVEAELLGAGVARGMDGLKTRSNAEVVTATLDLLETRSQGAETPAMTAGLPILDTINALQPGRLVVIAARPGVGKSLLGYQIAQHTAAAHGRGLYVSLEMTGEELMQRYLSHASKIHPHLLDVPRLMSEEWTVLVRAAGEVSPRAVDVLDYTQGELTLDTIIAVARRLKATSGLHFLVLDYLQLLPMPNVERVSEVQALQVITKKLKATAGRLGICLVALSQLSREGDGDRPKLRHLRGSGSIEQDADTAFLLWPNSAKGDDEGWKDGKRNLMLAAEKNRHGPMRTAEVFFDPATMTLGELAR